MSASGTQKQRWDSRSHSRTVRKLQRSSVASRSHLPDIIENIQFKKNIPLYYLEIEKKCFYIKWISIAVSLQRLVLNPWDKYSDEKGQRCQELPANLEIPVEQRIVTARTDHHVNVLVKALMSCWKKKNHKLK